MNLKSRLKAAFGLVLKGSIAPFDRIGFGGAGSGEKLSQAYAQSPWVSRAIKLISLPMTEVPLRFSAESRGSKQIIDDPSLLAWWESPAVGADKQPLSMADTIEATVGWLKLKGECFWVLDDTVFAPVASMPFPEAGRNFPRFLIANPERMRPLSANHDGALLAWELTDGRGRKFIFAPQQVVHLRTWNPYDDCRGLAEMDAARIPAESDYLASVFKRNLWRNNGDRGPIIGIKNGATLDDKQREQLINQLREKKELASQGIFKAAVIGGDISVEDPKAQTVDAGFVASRAEDPTAIFIAFGVPPSMATVTASYSVGSASDRYRLIEDTSAPTGKKITEAIERVVALQRIVSPSPSQGEGRGEGSRVFAWFDWSRHSVFQQVRNERIASGKTLWDSGMPWEKISEWLSLDLPEFDGWDAGYLPFSVTPVGSGGLPTEPQPEVDPAGLEPSEVAEEVDEASKAIHAAFTRKMVGRGSRRAVESSFESLCVCGGPGDATIVQKGRSAKEVALWKTHMAKRRESLKRFESVINRELIKARAEVLAKLNKSVGLSKSSPSPLKGESAGERGDLITKAAAADFLFDLGTFRNGLMAGLRKATAASLQQAGSQLLAEIGFDDPFRFPDEKALSFLAQRENKLVNAAQEIFNGVRTELEEGITAGESISKLSDRIRGKFNDISATRARTIAMTETAAAYGAARQEAMEQSGVEYKQWLTSGAGNVRAAHAAANGQTVPVGEPFDVGGETLECPGDPTGSPGNVINCHCVAIAVSESRANKILMTTKTREETGAIRAAGEALRNTLAEMLAEVKKQTPKPEGEE